MQEFGDLLLKTFSGSTASTQFEDASSLMPPRRKSSTGSSLTGSDLEEHFYSPRSRPASGASSERAPLKSNLGQKPPVIGMQTSSIVDRDQKMPQVGEDGAAEPSASPLRVYQQPKWAESWSASVQASQGDYQPLRNSQHGEHALAPALAQDLQIDADDSPRAGPDDWRVPARHAPSVHRRWPSNAARSVRGASNPGPAAWTPNTDFAGRFPVQTPAPGSASTPAVLPAPAPPPKKAVTKGSPKKRGAAGGSQNAQSPGRTLEPNPMSVSQEQPQTIAITAPPAGAVVRMGRRDGWARFLAYEGCWQICLQAATQYPTEATAFLKDGCAPLKTAFTFDSLLLKPVGQAGPPQGPTLVWDDAEAAQLDAVEFAPQTTKTSVVKCRPVRITLGGFQSQFSGEAYQEQLYVRLRPLTWQGMDAAYTPVDRAGNALVGTELEMSSEQMQEDILVEVCNDAQEVVAQTAVRVEDLWQVAGTQYSVDYVTVSKQKKGLLSFLPCYKAGTGTGVESMAGKKWLQVTDKLGTRSAHVLLSASLHHNVETIMATADVPPLLASTAMDGHGVSSKGYQQITSWQVYDLTLSAALKTQKCGPLKLVVEGEWRWLLERFASAYGICGSYATLAHLRWVMRPENATVRTECLELLGQKLGPLKQAEAAGSLLPQEVAILAHVEMDCERLLARCFESYHSLSAASPSGILEGGQDSAEIPAPALVPAVQLCSILRDVLEPLDQVWLAERFSTAAMRRYHRLSGAADDMHPYLSEGLQEEPQVAASRSGPLQQTAPSYKKMVPAETDMEVAYMRIEALCQAIKAELNNDLKIHDSAILPSFINLPQVTAGEYCREFLLRLKAVLNQFPPPQPSKPAVDLLVAVGEQQSYLHANNLLPPAGSPGALDALQVFGPYVTEWIASSQAALCQRCRQIEGSSHSTAIVNGKEAGKTHIAPLVEEMLERLSREVDRYERVVTYWPVFGPQLEGTSCAALRDTTGAVSRQCGLTQVSREEAALGHQPGAYLRGPSGYGAGSPARWRWNQTAPMSVEARLTVLPHEAVLMNSLRRLLTEVPQLELKLGRWAGGPSPQTGHIPSASIGSQLPPSPAHGGREMAGLGIEYTPDGRMGPQLGAQFAQLVKELRSEYAGAVTGCAHRISSVVFSLGPRILTLLQQHGLTGNPMQTAQEIEPVLEAMEEVMGRLARALEGRVYVAVCRGLWDFTSKEVFDYVEGLQEGQENKGAWRGRQNASSALDVVDNFFSAVLSSSLQHELQSKDLDLPLHSDRAHKLLADNTEAVNTSYTVY